MGSNWGSLMIASVIDKSSKFKPSNLCSLICLHSMVEMLFVIFAENALSTSGFISSPFNANLLGCFAVIASFLLKVKGCNYPINHKKDSQNKKWTFDSTNPSSRCCEFDLWTFCLKFYWKRTFLWNQNSLLTSFSTECFCTTPSSLLGNSKDVQNTSIPSTWPHS